MAEARGSSSVSFHVVAVVVGGFSVFCGREGGGGGWEWWRRGDTVYVGVVEAVEV